MSRNFKVGDTAVVGGTYYEVLRQTSEKGTWEILTELKPAKNRSGVAEITVSIILPAGVCFERIF